MSLESDQRAWLDLALQNKGRFTTKKSIRGDFENYRRRREKTANALGGVSDIGRTKQLVQDALDRADALAEAGKFKDAYKALNGAKKLAKTSLSGRSDTAIAQELEIPLNVINHYLRDHESIVAYHVRSLDGFIDAMDDVDKAGDEADMTAALQRRRDFVDEEQTLRGDYQRIRDRAWAYYQTMNGHGLADQFKETEAIAERLEKAGCADIIADQKARMLDLKRRAEADGKKLWSGTWLFKYVLATDKRLDAAVKLVRSLENFQKRDASDETPDQGSADFREDQLRETDNRIALLEREEQRLADAMEQLQRDLDTDGRLTTDTDRPPIHTIPEPEKFDSGDVFDDVLGMDVRPEHLSLQVIDEIKQRGVAALQHFLQHTPADDPKMFDLALKNTDDFRKMMAEELLGVTNLADLTENEKSLINDLADELNTTLCASIPNSMADDGQTMQMGADVYDFDCVLGRGAGGEAHRFIKRGTGETVVVKKPVDDPHDPDAGRQKLVTDLENHYRLMQGRADDGSSALTELLGAARSPDGSLFVIMEEVKGGDIDDADANLQTMTATGVLPENARQILAADMIRKTCMALKEMERLGFVHNDIKGGNIMLTEDGDVRVIDFDQSRFGDDEGRVDRGDNDFAGSPGYFAKDDEVATSKSDAYALGGMLQKLVANLKPVEWKDQAVNFETGALGRLIKALRTDDPDERPNYEAVLASAYLNSPTSDFSTHDIDDLRDASSAFSKQMSGMRIELDFDVKDTDDDEVANTKEYMNRLFSVYVPGFRPGETENMSMKALQSAASAVDADLRREHDKLPESPNPQKVHDEIKRLLDFRQYINNQLVAPAVKEREELGEAAYQSALDNPDNKMTLDVGKGPHVMNFKTAIAARDRVLGIIADKQKTFYDNMTDDEQVDFDRAAEVNAELLRLDALRKDIEDKIFAAMGDDAKFYLAKQKLAEVSAKFGSPTTGTEHAPPERDELDEAIGIAGADPVHKAVQEAAS